MSDLCTKRRRKGWPRSSSLPRFPLVLSEPRTASVHCWDGCTQRSRAHGAPSARPRMAEASFSLDLDAPLGPSMGQSWHFTCVHSPIFHHDISLHLLSSQSSGWGDVPPLSVLKPHNLSPGAHSSPHLWAQLL